MRPIIQPKQAFQDAYDKQVILELLKRYADDRDVDLSTWEFIPSNSTLAKGKDFAADGILTIFMVDEKLVNSHRDITILLKQFQRRHGTSVSFNFLEAPLFAEMWQCALAKKLIQLNITIPLYGHPHWHLWRHVVNWCQPVRKMLAFETLSLAPVGRQFDIIPRALNILMYRLDIDLKCSLLQAIIHNVLGCGSPTQEQTNEIHRLRLEVQKYKSKLRKIM
ncbi:hypothetical protein BCR33DRAFT_726862 [Rhizoclosmatium globosum]|uniref:Uncharacterized protein n=1 Tax=Rhizoclosmatium globosum TaxID=329046 RepID=A0A1Y2ASS1_9FUNG|nr:hypothetical protein BCR33DRAFT_726862 [Rhizoclosmatium globosum]|eukprot:ORY25609.1 hypothetical protein BCR33DRAFT_726862 [Rhizoclosmatium globosum]